MNEPEIQHLIETDLRRAMAKRGLPPQPDPADATPWVAMSLMQKAIRRGREDLALRAAATLLRDAPERLWRRLGCIAADESFETSSIYIASEQERECRASVSRKRQGPTSSESLSAGGAACFEI